MSETFEKSQLSEFFDVSSWCLENIVLIRQADKYFTFTTELADLGGYSEGDHPALEGHSDLEGHLNLTKNVILQSFRRVSAVCGQFVSIVMISGYT